MSTMAGDVRSREQMHKIVQDTVERCGGLDIVVANAGDAHAPVRVVLGLNLRVSRYITSAPPLTCRPKTYGFPRECLRRQACEKQLAAGLPNAA